MGYTNYWHQEKDFTTDEWDLIFSEFLYLLETMPNIIIDDSPIVNKGSHPGEPLHSTSTLIRPLTLFIFFFSLIYLIVCLTPLYFYNLPSVCRY